MISLISNIFILYRSLQVENIKNRKYSSTRADVKNKRASACRHKLYNVLISCKNFISKV